LKKPPIEPLSEIIVPPEIQSLPKADIHVHQEGSMRLNRVLAKQGKSQLYDWMNWSKKLMADYAAGAARLSHIGWTQPEPGEADTPENLVLRYIELFEEFAADGAIFVEVRPGYSTVVRPEFMTLFREAEKRVQEKYPQFCAAAIVCLQVGKDADPPDVIVQNCIRWAREGLGGVDLLYRPYDTEADWQPIYRLAEPLADAGLGITAHAGEVSAANIAAAIRVPGLTRIGHGTYAAQDPHLMELLLKHNITLECSLSCNVVLGAALSYEEHPIRQFVDAGIPVALCTDDPVQICTTIGREYALAYQLGFSQEELRNFTRNAINAAFISDEQRKTLLAQV
jgi:adenosine deaminase